MRIATTVGTVLLIAAPAFAHVGVMPRESASRATETYTFRVPSEGARTTTAVILDVPDGVTIVSVSAPEGATHEEKTIGDRIVQVTWTIEIAAGARAELSFVATNPARGESISWNVHQKYSDGTVSDWIGAPGSRSPAPVTKLIPAAER